jgi:hypothetical protein
MFSAASCSIQSAKTDGHGTSAKVPRTPAACRSRARLQQEHGHLVAAHGACGQ